MRLKQRIGDFRVRELLVEGYLQEKGQYRVYRVTKRKITTPEALDILAAEAGVEVGKIGLAGWKDRQGITVQYMSIPRGRVVRLQSQELLIETEGFSDEPFSSDFSRGNAFEINVRNLVGSDLKRMRVNLPLIRQFGYVDYFDDQRFGNLVHGQGWIAKDLMLGEHEKALKAMVAAPSPRDNDYFKRFKGALERCWGDWSACRDVAGRYGAHHSIFEALGRDPEDFAGAFTHVSSRFRLIHLYAWQSHLWNRAVTRFMRDHMPLEERLLIECAEGTLVMPAGEPNAEILGRENFRLPGERLEDVLDPAERQAYEDILADEGMIADQLFIDGVSGFFMKGEARSLMVKPMHLRVRPALDDPLNPGARMLRIRFELPRGSYASLLIKRLFAYGQRSNEERMVDAQSGSAQRDFRGIRDGNRPDFSGQGGRGYGGDAERGRERGQERRESYAGDRGYAGRGDGRPGAYQARGRDGDQRGGGYHDRNEQGGGRQRERFEHRGHDNFRGRGDQYHGGGQRGGDQGRGSQGGYRGHSGRRDEGDQRSGGYRGQGDHRGDGRARHGDAHAGGDQRGRRDFEGGGYRAGEGQRGAGYRSHGDQRQGGYQGRGDHRGRGDGRDSGDQSRGGYQGGGNRGRGDFRDGGHRGHEQGGGAGGYQGRDQQRGPARERDDRHVGDKRGGARPSQRAPRDDQQSGGYRMPKKEIRREAPRGRDDGWS